MKNSDVVLENWIARLKQINPAGFTENCAECAIATDMMLEGLEFRAATEGSLTGIDLLERLFGTEFDYHLTFLQVEASLKAAGQGAKAIIHGYRNTPEVGHFINAINHMGEVIYLDGQAGRLADIFWFVDGGLSMLRTDS